MTDQNECPADVGVVGIDGGATKLLFWPFWRSMVCGGGDLVEWDRYKNYSI